MTDKLITDLSTNYMWNVFTCKFQLLRPQIQYQRTCKTGLQLQQGPFGDRTLFFSI